MMKFNIIALLVAAASGSAMAFQGALNSALAKVVGLLETTLIVMVIGAAAALASLYLSGAGISNMPRLTGAPWHYFLGGLLIVAITYGVAFSIPRVGAANATTAIVGLQVLTAICIDHFGLFGLERIPFSWWQVGGLVLLAAGTRLMLIH